MPSLLNAASKPCFEYRAGRNFAVVRLLDPGGESEFRAMRSSILLSWILGGVRAEKPRLFECLGRLSSSFCFVRNSFVRTSFCSLGMLAPGQISFTRSTLARAAGGRTRWLLFFLSSWSLDEAGVDLM